jgi:hypothetical protein
MKTLRHDLQPDEGLTAARRVLNQDGDLRTGVHGDTMSAARLLSRT